jgi:hypothetical protein
VEYLNHLCLKTGFLKLSPVEATADLLNTTVSNGEKKMGGVG